MRASHHGWNVHGQNSSLPGVPDPQAECPKIDLSRHAWVKLNRLRTGTGLFRATLYRWKMENNPLCPCGLGKEQSANHIPQGCCLLHRLPGTAQDLAQTTPAIRYWLETNKLDIQEEVPHERRRIQFGHSVSK